jgi:hypothetical protein
METEILLLRGPPCLALLTIINNKNDLRIILLRRARFIELDTRFLCIKPPAAGDLPTVEVLSISGNIVDLGAFFNRWTRLRVLGVTSRRQSLVSLASAGVLLLAEPIDVVQSRTCQG